MATTSETALLTATAVHAGFQVTVMLLVYPALFRAPDWDSAHTAHRRAITPLVAVVYVALVAAAAPALISGVSDVGTAVALAGITLSLGVTAAVAAPLQGRSSHGRDGGLVRRLRLADLVRTLGACVAVSGAVLAAL